MSMTPPAAKLPGAGVLRRARSKGTATRLLLVDCDQAVRDVLSDVFSRAGFAVTAVDQPRKALRLAATGDFQVMLTELALPLMNGIELTAGCRAVAPRMQVVTMSAIASAADFKRVLNLGAHDLLVKPFQPDEAVVAVQRAASWQPGFGVTFDGLALPDVLQMCHQLRRTDTVVIAGAGRVIFLDGQIVHAEAGADVGEAALVRLLDLAHGELSLEPGALGRRTIQGGFDNVLLAAIATLDEQRAGRRGLPSAADAADGEASFAGLLDGD